MRVMFDTNVLISAFVFPGGTPEAVYLLVLNGDVHLVTSRPLLAEFGRALSRKFGWEPDYAEEAVAQLARLAEVVEPVERISVITRDPDDNRVLEAAVAGRVDAIVSGDRDLLELASWREIPICDPATFLSQWTES